MRSLFVQLPNFDLLVRCYTPGEVKQVNYVSVKSNLQHAPPPGNPPEENNIIILIMSDFVKTWPALTVGGWIRRGGQN